METVATDGSRIDDHFDGRTLNPGHAIEGSWFILNEAKYRNNDPDLIKLGTTMLDWMWEIGWDKEYGGIIYFRDVKELPVQEYWHDMKFWWPQNEAIIATLMAYEITRNIQLKEIRTETPLQTCVGWQLSRHIVLVPVLRAGLGMVDGITSLIPTAKIDISPGDFPLFERVGTHNESESIYLTWIKYKKRLKQGEMEIGS